MSRILTTGASRGLGAALARAFAARGDAVVAVARNEAEVRVTSPTRTRPTTSRAPPRR